MDFKNLPLLKYKSKEERNDIEMSILHPEVNVDHTQEAIQITFDSSINFDEVDFWFINH